MFLRNTHPNFAVSGCIIASCIRRLVTSNGYENDWDTAPAKPPQSNFAGIDRTRPPVRNSIVEHFRSVFPTLQLTCVTFTFFAGKIRCIFHEKKLQIFKTEKRESRIWDHANQGGQKSSVEGSESTFLKFRNHTKLEI
jgi:hypothetical protein